ncbi:hypothetical protein GCM10023215_56340 [Pseudonocardia yuanmonensis]|uniref:Uncharacterized protein n=1 Tax=Pseudonocardia yuanmonensis TaxID=1095914 RepID=A0ABP8XKH8_9PSEU
MTATEAPTPPQGLEAAGRYAIDLAGVMSEALRATLAPDMPAGRPQRTTRKARRRAASSADRERNRAIPEWARGRACRSPRAGASRTTWPSATSAWPRAADAREQTGGPMLSEVGAALHALLRVPACGVPRGQGT